MAYWYIRATVSETSDNQPMFGKVKWTKPKEVKGKVIGIGNTGFYGSHPCYIVVVKEGKNPIVEHVLLDSDQTGDCRHEILELTYRRK